MSPRVDIALITSKSTQAENSEISRWSRSRTLPTPDIQHFCAHTRRIVLHMAERSRRQRRQLSSDDDCFYYSKKKEYCSTLARRFMWLKSLCIQALYNRSCLCNNTHVFLEAVSAIILTSSSLRGVCPRRLSSHFFFLRTLSSFLPF